jgi:hypothetical protein
VRFSRAQGIPQIVPFVRVRVRLVRAAADSQGCHTTAHPDGNRHD